MNQLMQILSLGLVLLVVCQALEVSEDSDADRPSGLHLADDVGANSNEDSRFPGVMDEARLGRLQDEVRALKQWLAYVSHSTGELDKRYKPSGFLGSRGKRFIPGLESLLLARYYKDYSPVIADAEKFKRQPHLGFHGSRG
ncbi:hypothetical protein BsWGS_09482 [Bradybaena similaris]